MKCGQIVIRDQVHSHDMGTRSHHTRLPDQVIAQSQSVCEDEIRRGISHVCKSYKQGSLSKTEEAVAKESCKAVLIKTLYEEGGVPPLVGLFELLKQGPNASNEDILKCLQLLRRHQEELKMPTQCTSTADELLSMLCFNRPNRAYY